MLFTPDQSNAKPAPSKAMSAEPPDIASASIPDTIAQLKVSPDVGLTRAEVDGRRQEHGYNEVAQTKAHPIRQFLEKFWGITYDDPPQSTYVRYRWRFEFLTDQT